MANLITAQKTYKTYDNACAALRRALGREVNSSLDDLRWLIAATSDGRFVPTVLGAQYIPLAHRGIMVIG